MPFAPLTGIRVVDLTSSFAGPTATAILAAFGADVVKIERPERGDEARDWGPPFFEGGSVMFFAANAGKRSLALDLKSPQGLDVLLRLADRADVVVQSLRPGAAERLGIGPDVLRARSPKLVYATIASAAQTPVPMSTSEAPTRTGGPPGSPVMLMIPAAACTRGS